MAKKVESIKHKTDTRAHIPSKEEAGYEDANAKVQDGKKVLELPKNPVVHRGQDPELFWLNKYGNDDRDDLLRVDIRSLYRHEHIAPETLIKNLYRVHSGQWVVDRKTGEKKLTTNHYTQTTLFDVNELFGNALDKDEIEKVSEYYHHQDGWTNRLIQGDSHLVMASLLEREGMAGQVQTIFFDPPYGIKYGSNWQMKLNDKKMGDSSKDEELSSEPEQIKAFRDTWELGIHSYLSYVRDRLIIARELLTDSGSVFVQISEENVHLLRSVMDEVFGSENFIAQITFRKKTMPLGTTFLEQMSDFILWFGKKKDHLKYRPLYKNYDVNGSQDWNWIELEDGSRRKMTTEEQNGEVKLPKKARVFRLKHPSPIGNDDYKKYDVEFEGRIYKAPNNGWGVDEKKFSKLVKLNRVQPKGNILNYILFHDDFPITKLTNPWYDTVGPQDKKYVVQTGDIPILRCILMTTDPGDLVLDPTCGSGTTAFVAEQWGRRWITIDTSRIALNIAKQRLMTAVFPYYLLYDSEEGQAFLKKQNKTNHHTPTTNHSNDIRQGFIYKTVPHITLKSLANDEPPATETLYDQPETDNKKLRVSGPFTVETLQNFEPISPADLDDEVRVNESAGAFEEVIKQHLLSAGIKNGRKNEMVVFRSVELLAGEALHAEGFYYSGEGRVNSDEHKTNHSSLTTNHSGERKAYFHIGPKFGTVSKKLVNDAVKECRQKGDANWLIILGFSFESDIEGGTQTTSMGNFEVTKVRIHDDLLQEGLKKKPAKSAASFVTIGEPDIDLVDNGQWLVDSNKKILCNYDIFKKLSGADSLAKINGLGQADLSAYIILSQRRDVWIDFSNAKGGSKHSGQHSGRTGSEQYGGVSSILGDSQRFFSGIADFNHFISELRLSDTGQIKTIVDELRRSRKNAEWLAEVSFSKELTTNHYALTTIKGLDIYDPIKDEVKARNVNDIAYWMVDEDYDGSNFVVKQVFFCGGDKDAFAKWRKGLDTIAKDSTKKKVEKTLKIEIDDEAFDRLYGHISHPIEVKKKGQKIAVRIISQFGEESTKVLTV